jgi:hypothetical protein
LVNQQTSSKDHLYAFLFTSMILLWLYLRIGHDNSGFASDWFFEYVGIYMPKYNHTWIFSYGKWLSQSRNEHQFEIEFFWKIRNHSNIFLSIYTCWLSISICCSILKINIFFNEGLTFFQYSRKFYFKGEVSTRLLCNISNHFWHKKYDIFMTFHWTTFLLIHIDKL